MAERSVQVVITGDASHIRRAFQQVNADSEKFSSSMRQNVGGGSGFASGAMGLMAGVAGGAVVGGFALAIRSAADFQTSLSVFKATATATGAEMKSVSELAIKLGNDASLPATSAKDAALAMVELAKGGLSVSDAMNAARATLQLSAAAQIDNATAAQIVSDSLNAFALNGTKAAMVADLLAQSANLSTASMPEMADALKMTSAVAHQMHVPIREVVTELTQMANAGIKGSDAGTSIKTMLLRLAAPTGAAAKMMSLLHISTFNAHGGFVGMHSIISQFSPVLARMTDAQKASTLSTIFGTDAIRAASVILGTTAKKHDALSKQLGVQGSAAKLAAAQTAGFNGAMNAFKSTVETLAISIGTKLLPVATRIANWLSAELPVAVAFAQAKFEQIQPALMLVGDGLRRIAEWAARNKHVLLPLVAVIGTLIVGMKVFFAVLRIATAAQAAFNLVMALNPIGLVVIAIAALVAGVAVAYARFPAFRRVVDGLWGALKTGASWMWTSVKPILDALASAASKIASTFGTVIGTVGSVTGGVGKALGGLHIPGFATGGIVTRPTLAMIGEAGPEAIVPLSGANRSGGWSGGSTFVFNQVPANADPHAIAAAVSWKLRTVS